MSLTRTCLLVASAWVLLATSEHTAAAPQPPHSASSGLLWMFSRRGAVAVDDDKGHLRRGALERHDAVRHRRLRRISYDGAGERAVEQPQKRRLADALVADEREADVRDGLARLVAHDARLVGDGGGRGHWGGAEEKAYGVRGWAKARPESRRGCARSGAKRRADYATKRVTRVYGCPQARAVG